MRSQMTAAEELSSLSRRFGGGPARRKLKLMEALAHQRPRGRRPARRLAATVNFIRAYPDNAKVLAAAREVAELLPDADIVHYYPYGVMPSLLSALPGRLEIAWDDYEDETSLMGILEHVMLPGEAEVMSLPDIELREWLDTARPGWANTDLEHVIGLMERSSLSPSLKSALLESAEVSIHYQGPGSQKIQIPTPRIHYQRLDVDRKRFPLRPIICRPIRQVRRGGPSLIAACIEALCARKLEIYPLTHANPSDAVLIPCGRGIEIALLGVLPEWRSALESLYFFLVIKNGVPIAYGPASAIGGCCEMGINLFPEFRGGEIRYIYAQFMRTLHHRLGVDYFYLTPYGMGEDNEDALRSGAFWFYRKLGFRPTNPAVEELARAEEKRMVARPGYRSDRKILRRLARTGAFFDLFNRGRRCLDIARLALAESRFIAETFSGDRDAARKKCASRAARLLGVDPQNRALQALGPMLLMIDDLPGWNPRDKAALAAFVRAKDRPSEAEAARRLAKHQRLLDALDAIERRGKSRPSH